MYMTKTTSRESEVLKRWNIPITHPVKEAFCRWIGGVGMRRSVFILRIMRFGCYRGSLPIYGIVHKVRDLETRLHIQLGKRE